MYGRRYGKGDWHLAGQSWVLLHRCYLARHKSLSLGMESIVVLHMVLKMTGRRHWPKVDLSLRLRALWMLLGLTSTAKIWRLLQLNRLAIDGRSECHLCCWMKVWSALRSLCSILRCGRSVRPMGILDWGRDKMKGYGVVAVDLRAGQCRI